LPTGSPVLRDKRRNQHGEAHSDTMADR